MRQLLQVDEHQTTIVGLHDRVYIGSLNSETVVELPYTPPPPPASGNDKNQQQQSKDAAATIQAVALHTSAEATYFAVARHDKSLTIYQQNKSPAVNVVQTYATPKRVSCLRFATVDETLLMVIAGDLAGDATAYPAKPRASSKDHQQSKDDKKQQASRLLLGHTASMLTALDVVESSSSSSSSSNRTILTADRDEKIRISRFPATHQIQGFLLGHEAYVTSLDVIPIASPQQQQQQQQQQQPVVVSCSGDGTVRIWDRWASGTSSEDYSASAVHTLSASSFAASTSNGESEEDKPPMIPTKVQWLGSKQNNEILRAALIFDESDQLVVLKYVPGEAQLQEEEEVVSSTGSSDDNNNSNEDAVRRLDLATHDDLVITLASVAGSPRLDAHRLTPTNGEDKKMQLELVKDLPFAVGLGKLLMKNSAESITMPSSLLDRDATSGLLCLEKQSESRTNHVGRAWNNAERIDIAKARSKRGKKRRREQQANSNSNAQGNDNNGNQNEAGDNEDEIDGNDIDDENGDENGKGQGDAAE